MLECSSLGKHYLRKEDLHIALAFELMKLPRDFDIQRCEAVVSETFCSLFPLAVLAVELTWASCLLLHL